MRSSAGGEGGGRRAAVEVAHAHGAHVQGDERLPLAVRDHAGDDAALDEPDGDVVAGPVRPRRAPRQRVGLRDEAGQRCVDIVEAGVETLEAEVAALVGGDRVSAPVRIAPQRAAAARRARRGGARPTRRRRGPRARLLAAGVGFGAGGGGDARRRSRPASSAAPARVPPERREQRARSEEERRGGSPRLRAP